MKDEWEQLEFELDEEEKELPPTEKEFEEASELLDSLITVTRRNWENSIL